MGGGGRGDVAEEMSHFFKRVELCAVRPLTVVDTQDYSSHLPIMSMKRPGVRSRIASTSMASEVSGGRFRRLSVARPLGVRIEGVT